MLFINAACKYFLILLQFVRWFEIKYDDLKYILDLLKYSQDHFDPVCLLILA